MILDNLDNLDNWDTKAKAWLYQQYRRNLHRPERPTRPRPDVLAWWIAAQLRTLAWALEHRSMKP